MASSIAIDDFRFAQRFNTLVNEFNPFWTVGRMKVRRFIYAVFNGCGESTGQRVAGVARGCFQPVVDDGQQIGNIHDTVGIARQRAREESF